MKPRWVGLAFSLVVLVGCGGAGAVRVNDDSALATPRRDRPAARPVDTGPTREDEPRTQAEIPPVYAPGCEPAVAPPENNEYVTPPHGPAYMPILELGGAPIESFDDATVQGLVPLAPQFVPGGRTIQFQIFLATQDMDDDDVAEPEVATYYARAPLSPADTIATFLAAGGILYDQRATTATDAIDADAVIESVGTGATRVEVGPYDAALVRGDPIGGVRPRALFWSDGVRDLTIKGDIPSTEIIDMARSIYCPVVGAGS